MKTKFLLHFIPIIGFAYSMINMKDYDNESPLILAMAAGWQAIVICGIGYYLLFMLQG